MTDYNFDHPDFTQEHIAHLQVHPLEACQRENASLRIRLETFNRMLIEAKEESQTRLVRIKQVRAERDAAFNEGEAYAKGEIREEIGIVRRERHEAEVKRKEAEEKEAKARERLRDMERELEEFKEERKKGVNRMEGVDRETINLLKERERFEEELREAKEIIKGKDFYIQRLEEETRSMSANVEELVAERDTLKEHLTEASERMSMDVEETPPAESEPMMALTKQFNVLLAEKNDLLQQLEIVTENLMGTTPKENTPEIGIPEKNRKRAVSTLSINADPDSDVFQEFEPKLQAPSPLRQTSTPESNEDADEEELKISIETNESDNSRERYRKNKEIWSQRLTDRIKSLEKKNMRLERYHDISHVTRAFLSLTPVHFEALRELKERKRKEGLILLDVMSKEHNSLRKQNRNLEKQLKLLADMRSREKDDSAEAQDFILTQRRCDSKEEAVNIYKRLYDQAQMAMQKMIETGAGVDAEEVTELRKERDIYKKRKEELEEEIDGSLGLRKQLAFSVAGDTGDVYMATQLTRVKAELEWRTKERDIAMEESHVEQNLTSIKELMDQLSQNLEKSARPIERQNTEHEELTKKYQICLRQLSDKKEKIKTLESFLEDKYMETEDLAGDEHSDSLRARLARTLMELYQVKRTLMEKTIQRNSLTKSAVNCLTTVLRENETLKKTIDTLKKHPDRDPERPVTDVDLENEETIASLQQTVDSLTKRLNKADSAISSAEKRAAKSKDRLESYIGMHAFGGDSHPRVKALRESRARVAVGPNATDTQVIAILKNQLKDTDDFLNFVCAKLVVLSDERRELDTGKVEAAERRLEECMDLVGGPLGQNEAWDNLKGLLSETRETLVVKMKEWKEKDKERDWAVESLENLLKESEERGVALAKLLHAAQEDVESKGTQGGRIAELEEQLKKNEEMISNSLRENDQHKAETDGLESFLQASEVQTTQLEEQLSRIEEKIQYLQQEKDNHKAEAERLEDLLKASETKTAQFFRILRDEEEEQYREEIERLHELLLMKEEEDNQYREEIERLHELHTMSEAKTTELLEISLKTSTRLSHLEDEGTRWKNVAGESIREIEQLQSKLEDLEAEIELLRIANHQNADTQTEMSMAKDMETQTESPESPSTPALTSSIPEVAAPKPKKSKKKAPNKKSVKRGSQDSRYNPHQDSASESPDEELEDTKTPKPQPPPPPKPKPNISIRRELAHPVPSPSPAPSIQIKFVSKKNLKKAESKEREEYDSLYRDEGGAESEDEEVPATEVEPVSPVEEMQNVEVNGARRSRRTRNKSPVYVGEFIVEGPGRAQKRKAVRSENSGRGKRGKR
ncbi:hypothetical protein SBOR_5778 [Sclerotinia borealis F-4128]|uniref:Uncharacterized protein n=1 Tax=Sclerotinia borealis (strain F-4128) TaxID=1432307 RepID=W9CAS6_SCLBF|nr:hypothetical protein SBOR_5778 [Sclerotinia borealis F-4128]